MKVEVSPRVERTVTVTMAESEARQIKHDLGKLTVCWDLYDALANALGEDDE